MPRPSHWRALLVLGRISNLPTVWSNCLAGWWLGGGGSIARLLILCLGASCLYIGGMYLNDAFDAEFDRQHRRERPIPSGAVSERAVWRWSFGWMILGFCVLTSLGVMVMTLTLILVGSIIFYDAVHKLTPFSPVWMALCRFWLLLVAAAAGADGVSGLSIWGACGLAAYVIGLSYVAKFESTPGALRYWPLVFLAGPVVIGIFANAGPFLIRALVFSLMLGGWIAWCLRSAFGPGQRNYGRTVSGLLAGMVWVDVLAVCGATPVLFAVFSGLFGLALLLQRFIPAT